MSGQSPLLQQIEDHIKAGNIQLPPASEVSSQLQEVTRQSDYDVNDVIKLISSDTALTAEILRVSNSAFYGGLTEIKSVKEAVVRLGTPEIVKVAILVIEKKNYQVESPALQEFLEPLWSHAQATAMGARWLAVNLGFENLENEAFIGGLLHDIGKLLLVKTLDDILQENPEQPNLPENLILEILESAHTTQGYILAKMWALPEKYCEIIKDHHNPNIGQASSLMNIISLADKACTQLGIGLKDDPSILLAATEEAFTLNASDMQLARLSIMLEDELALV